MLIAIITIFILAFVGILVAESLDKQHLRYFTKPLLMPMLGLIYIALAEKTNIVLLISLLCSWFGDIFLMWPKNKRCFTFGLITFLIAHILYCAVILRLLIPEFPLPFYVYLLLLPYLITGVIIFSKLTKHLGSMKLPVVVYMIFLLGMSYLCALLVNSHSNTASALIFTGSLCFIISDTILALHNFRKPNPNAGVYFMTTYVIAQVLIVLGLSCSNIIELLV